MRLRSQAYSSLYGYAGTAINPYSYISLFDFDLGHALTQQHLDKMDEFHRGLVSWQTELPETYRLIRSWDGSMLNFNRVNANLHLIHHQVSGNSCLKFRAIPNGYLLTVSFFFLLCSQCSSSFARRLSTLTTSGSPTRKRNPLRTTPALMCNPPWRFH